MNEQQSENKIVKGFCDVCGKRETNTTDALKADGWHLGSREHFCPNCND